MVDEAEPKVSTHRPILPKTSVSPKSKPRAVKARSSCSPNLKATPLKADKAEKIEKLSMTDLTDEQKRKVLEYTPRDRAKAARIVSLLLLTTLLSVLTRSVPLSQPA
jgi:hypothetical protein